MLHFDRFAYFCRLQLATGDYDAHLPFLNGLADHCELDLEEQVWLGFLYMGYYNEASAWSAFNRPGVRDRRKPPPADLPITTQRRNLYGGRVVRHFTDLYSKPRGHDGRLSNWLRSITPTWTSLLDRIGSIYGNGRWASYTTAELMNDLAGLGLEPTTYEVLDSSGPRKGLQALGLQPSEASANQVMQALQAAGLTLGITQLESLLCDWAGMNKGTFYAGRNIDRQQGRIMDVQAKLGAKFPTLWAVRAKVFPADTLGELQGWQGIDKDRLKHYQTTGQVLAPHEARTSARPSKRVRP